MWRHSPPIAISSATAAGCASKRRRTVKAYSSRLCTARIASDEELSDVDHGDEEFADSADDSFCVKTKAAELGLDEGMAKFAELIASSTASKTSQNPGDV